MHYNPNIVKLLRPEDYKWSIGGWLELVTIMN